MAQASQVKYSVANDVKTGVVGESNCNICSFVVRFLSARFIVILRRLLSSAHRALVQSRAY